MLAVVCVVLLASVLVWFNYSAVLPLIAEEWGLSGTRAGIVFAAFQVGYLAAILPAGSLADRYAARRVIAVGATGTGLFSLAFSLFATGFLSGSALRLVSGVFMAGVYVPGMRFLSGWFPSESRGKAMGLYVGAFSLSSGLSFLLSSSVASAVDWQLAIAVTSLSAIAAGPIMLVFAADPPDPTQSDRGIDLSLFRNREYVYAVAIYTAHSWELYGVRNWILAFLLTVPAVMTTENPSLWAGVLAGVVMTVGGLGNLLSGWASDYVGRSTAIGVALGTSTTITIALGFLQWLPLVALVVLLVAYGIALTGDSAPTSTAITEVVDDGNVGAALAIQSLVGFSATAVSPVVFGLVLDRAGYRPAFLTLAAGAAIGLLCLGLLSRSRSNGTSDGTPATRSG
jgi:MFS family permease